MKSRHTIIGILTVAMALGTAWAVRGKFGHEQGAAWAGAVGAMALILVSRRSDWYPKVFKMALAAAVGWGMGGMISYGVVVGYGRASDFGNVYYGLLMLFVIGALYGFLGGGLLGLSIADSKTSRVKWHALAAEMLALGFIVYAFLIDQLEWLMTPPRSEMWAGCLGAALALAWYMIRNNQSGALRVAVYAALGAGFGFAFGNFLQVLGTGSSLPFNFWNVMEYSIGFFGGIGMAYGALTTKWQASDPPSSKHSNLVPIILVAVFVPFVLWDQSFIAGKLGFILKSGGDENTILTFQWMAIIAIVIMMMIMFIRFYRLTYSYGEVRWIFMLYLGVYTFLSFLLTGIYTHPIEQYLYLANIAMVLFMLPGLENSFYVREDSPKRWTGLFVLILVILAVLAYAAIGSHGELKGSQIRFQ